MNKSIICILFSGTDIFNKIGNEDIFDEDLNELKEIALILKEEYGITFYQAKEPDPAMFFEEIQKKELETKVLVFKDKPTFPIPDEIFVKNKKKSAFPPPKIGKISSKPKGRKR